MTSLIGPPEGSAEKEVEENQGEAGNKVDKDHPEPAWENISLRKIIFFLFIERNQFPSNKLSYIKVKLCTEHSTFTKYGEVFSAESSDGMNLR